MRPVDLKKTGKHPVGFRPNQVTEWSPWDLSRAKLKFNATEPRSLEEANCKQPAYPPRMSSHRGYHLISTPSAMREDSSPSTAHPHDPIFHHYHPGTGCEKSIPRLDWASKMVTSVPAFLHNQPAARPAMPLPITAIFFFIILDRMSLFTFIQQTRTNHKL